MPEDLYLGTVEGHLHAIDADSGQLCAAFGDHGILNVDQWNTINPKFPYELNQSVSVYKDTLIVGWAGEDWTWEDSPPGTVFGIDARTGAKKWEFQTEPENMRSRIGTTNVWASMSVDVRAWAGLSARVARRRTISGAATGLQDMPYATSVTALHADTGQVAWSRQLVHHDIWDVDTNAAPTLVDIHKNGQTIPALVQTTKQGFLFVLNRLTGEPIYPDHRNSGAAVECAGRKGFAYPALHGGARAYHAALLPRHLLDRRSCQLRPMLTRLCQLSRRRQIHPAIA